MVPIAIGMIDCERSEVILGDGVNGKRADRSSLQSSLPWREGDREGERKWISAEHPVPAIEGASVWMTRMAKW